MGKIHSFAVPGEKAKLWDELWHQFTLIAKKEHRTAGSLMAEFVEKLVQEHANGNPQFSLTDFDSDIVIPARPTVPSKYTEEDWNRFDEPTRREILRDYQITVKRVASTLEKEQGKTMTEAAKEPDPQVCSDCRITDDTVIAFLCPSCRKKRAYERGRP